MYYDIQIYFVIEFEDKDYQLASISFESCQVFSDKIYGDTCERLKTGTAESFKKPVKRIINITGEQYKKLKGEPFIDLKIHADGSCETTRYTATEQQEGK
jgi:hypothetical protein